MKQTIELKRAYDPYSATDGYRVYIDRLWPRGLSHETFHYDLWEKNISPSTSLREWFHADPDNRWEEFTKRYRAELKANPDFNSFLNAIAGKTVITLLYSSHDRLHNNAIVVRDTITANNQ